MPRTLFIALILAISLVPAVHAEPLLVCGADTVFEIDTTAALEGSIARRWSWVAQGNRQLPQALWATFRSTDDCKPVDGGSKLLISSSSGGCCLIERASGKVLWYAQVPNAHSLEILPGNRIVAASSTNPQGNRLMLFEIARGNALVWETALVSAHGVVWDEGRKVLWALGLNELRCYELKDWEREKPSLNLKASYPLPDDGGHDLQPVPGSADLLVTTHKHVYLFERDKRQFRLHPELGAGENVKSVCVHPITGQTAYVKATESWWSDTLGLLHPAGKIQLPGQRLYKARWSSAAAKVSSARLAKQALRVGLARVCITPERPVWLHGYAAQPRFRPFEGKLNELYAKAMALEDARGERSVLITLDLCTLRAAEAKVLFQRLAEKTGLERRQLLVNFSHTHSAPIIGASDLFRYPMSEADRQATLAYTAKLFDQLADVARAALADLQPASLSWGTGKCGFVRNRRQYDAHGAYRRMGPNPDKPVDDVVPVLRISTPGGHTRAIVFGCACHAVTLGQDNLKLSGDYPSFAQEAIESSLPGVQAMFVQGCGADANSDPRCGPNQEQHVRRQGQSLAAEVCRVAQGTLEPVRGPLEIKFREVDLPLKPVPPVAELKKMSGVLEHNARRMLAAVENGQPLPSSHRHPLALWRFGNDLTFVALSGEVVSGYASAVKRVLGGGRVWVAGYSNEVDGYLPDATIVAEGGYEARGLVADVGFYSADAEKVLLQAVAEFSAPARAENLLANGTLDAEQVAFPEFWTPSSSAQGVIYQRAGGPGGRKPAIVLRGEGGATREVSARQQGLVLAAGETYRLSAYIRTKGFKSRNAGLIVHNAGWTSDIGFKNLPADSDWTLREKTFTLFPSRDKEYGVAMFAIELRGEIGFADVKLEPVSEGARTGSRSPWALVATPRLVPYQPLLSRIPRSNPELVLKFYGNLPEKPEAYEALVTVEGDRIAPQTLPLRDGRIVVRLAGLACGEYALRAVVRQAATRRTVLEAAYPIRIIDVPVVDRSRIKPLNNLVAELLNEPVGKAPAPRTFTFVNPRDGWVFVALAVDSPATKPAATIDDRPLPLFVNRGSWEAFRELAVGPHRITIDGHAGAGRLQVRSIPEIFDYPPCADSAVKENGSYGWEFMQRHVLQAVTTLNGGALPGNALSEAKARGLKWLANLGVRELSDPANLQARMEQHAGLTQAQYDGFTADELFFGRTTIDSYTQALWRLRNPQQRLVYTWIVGKPSIAALHTDFMSAALNVSRGRGRLLYEAYCHPQPDEKAAAAYLDDMLGETIRRFNAMLPGAAAGTGIIFGNFNQIPIISLEFNPAVDFRYYLDMQVNRVANSPDFAGLGMVGYWGTYYGDEELARWSFLLMRHYAVEGRKEMLSARYGLKYQPGHLANGDFAEGLQGWTAAPAARGAIRAETLAGYGKNCQGRWGGGKAGDTVCTMTRQAGAANRIQQTAQGLVVGRPYCLQFVTADRKAVVAKKCHPRRYGIAAQLEGADLLPEKSFVHVDRRSGGRYEHNDNVGQINLNRIVFRAKSPSLVVAFHDADAAPGEELIVNFVQLKPYLEDRPPK
jgi:hypothetical protein